MIFSRYRVPALFIFLSLCTACTNFEVSPVTNPSTSGIKFYGNQYGNFLRSFEGTAEGGYMFAGYAYTSDTQNAQGFIQICDKRGNIVWYKTYGGANIDRFDVVHPTSDGGFIAEGVTASYGNASVHHDFDYDEYLVKTDAQGIVQWKKTFGGTLDDQFFDVKETPDHGFVAVGVIDNYNTNVVKTDQNGDTLWTRQLNQAKQLNMLNEAIWEASVSIGPNGDIAIATYSTYDVIATNSFVGNPTFTYLTASGSVIVPEIIYKSFGTSPPYQGSFNYSGLNIEKIVSMVDGFIIALTMPVQSLNPVVLIKVDFNGNLIWSQKYFGLGTAFFSTVINNSEGGVLISGGTVDASGVNNIWLLNTDSKGSNLWEKFIPISKFGAWAVGAVPLGNGFAVGVNLNPPLSYHADFFGFLTIDQNGKIIEQSK